MLYDEEYDEEQKEWLLRVMKKELDQDGLLKGYIKYYAMRQRSIDCMTRDLFFIWQCTPNIGGIITDNVKKEIQKYAGIDEG